MPDAARWALTILATFRLTWAVVVSDGPWDALLRLRTLAGCYDRGANGAAKTGAGRFLSCPYCVSVWAAVPPVLLALNPTAVGDAFLAWFGMAGAVALLARWRPWVRDNI